MAAKKVICEYEHKGKMLIILGLLAIVYGVLRIYGLSIPQIAIVVGALLMLKGIMLKYKK